MQIIIWKIHNTLYLFTKLKVCLSVLKKKFLKNCKKVLNKDVIFDVVTSLYKPLKI